jgi:hypothetical protein
MLSKNEEKKIWIRRSTTTPPPREVFVGEQAQ